MMRFQLGLESRGATMHLQLELVLHLPDDKICRRGHGAHSLRSRAGVSDSPVVDKTRDAAYKRMHSLPKLDKELKGAGAVFTWRGPC